MASSYARGLFLRSTFAALLPALEWVKIELSAEEEDAGAVVLEGAEAAGVGFDGLDLRVEPFGHGVGDRVAQVGDDILKMPLQHLRHFLHRLEAATARPPIPLLEELPRAAFITVRSWQL